MSEVQSEEKVTFMSALAEASHLVRAIGGNAGSRKEQRLRAWRKLASRFSWNRIVDLHRGEQRVRVTGDELNLLRATARQHDEVIREGRDEYRELVARIARLEAAMAVSDAQFFGPQIDGLRDATAQMGRKAGAVAEGEG